MPLTLKSQVVTALILLENGEWHHANTQASRILAAFPMYVVGYSLAARAMLGLGSLGNAAEMARRVLSADPENAEAYLLLGLIYRTTGDYARAESCLKRAWTLSPGNVHVQQALRELRFAHADQLQQPYSLSRYALARARLNSHLEKLAVSELELLHAQHPGRADIQVTLCEAYWQQGMSEAAVSVAANLLVSHPWCLKANLVTGAAWLRGKQDEYARGCLDVAQALDPENRWAQQVLGPRSPLAPRVVYLDWDYGRETEPGKAFQQFGNGEEEPLPD